MNELIFVERTAIYADLTSVETVDMAVHIAHFQFVHILGASEFHSHAERGNEKRTRRTRRPLSGRGITENRVVF